MMLTDRKDEWQDANTPASGTFLHATDAVFASARIAHVPRDGLIAERRALRQAEPEQLEEGDEDVLKRLQKLMIIGRLVKMNCVLVPQM